MAVPKRRTSKSKARKRRTHQKTSAPNLTKCSQCGEVKLPHNVCMECGTYKGREVLNSDED